MRHTSATLTAAALEENSRLEEAQALALYTNAVQDAVLTSGSEGEEDPEAQEMDADERLLSRAPDALSAGIRPKRKKMPLGAVKAPSHPSASRAPLSVTSSQRSSGLKRRHRQAGMSDKGSKRSHTSANGDMQVRQDRNSRRLRSAQPIVGGTDAGGSISKGPRKGSFGLSLGQAARQIFAVDEEVLDMMAQPGSVFR